MSLSDFLRLFFGQAVLLLAGWIALRALGIVFSRYACGEAIALAYLAGLAFGTLEMLGFTLAGFKFSFLWLILPWLLAAALFIYLMRRQNLVTDVNVAKTMASSLSAKVARGAMLFFITFIFVLILWRVFTSPLDYWDALSHWGYKAKVFYWEKRLVFPAGQEGHFYYPCLVPLAETWVYLALGRFQDAFAKIPFPLMYLSLLVVLYHALRRERLTPTAALLFVLALMTARRFNGHAAMGYADLPLAVYYGVGAFFLGQWLAEEGRREDLTLAGIFWGGALWIKAEGLPMVLAGILVAAWFARRKDWRAQGNRYSALIFLGLLLLFYLPWQVYRLFYGIGSQGEHLGTPNLDPFYLFTLGRLLAIDLFNPGKWGVIFWAVLLFSLLGWRHLTAARNGFFAWLLLANLFFVYLCHVVAPLPLAGIEQQVEVTLPRLVLHIVPVAVFFASLQAADIFPIFKEKNE